ncbi:hypothetical protein [Sphaerisporangium rhizosphaerae]|uniref:Uncharacterized protein n=1 Tax=Sphaerisporangium rhizosphaerae TaxID=2269375 RepID=A0ABW2P0N4_9ACTN
MTLRRRVRRERAMDRLTGDTLKTSAGAAIASITYGYDLGDNLTTKTTAGTAGAGTNTGRVRPGRRDVQEEAP